MPACRACKHFDAGICTLSGPLPADQPWEEWPEALRRKAISVCGIAIVMKYLPRITGDVLEVGHGVSKVFRRGLKRQRRGVAKWWGIDPLYPSAPERRSYGASAARMPMFPDQSMDWVVALQSMEHWHEESDRIEDGLIEVRRVLKPGGWFLATVPFHIHGAKLFWDGDAEQLIERVSPEWSSIAFERWRWDHRPLPKLENWKIAYELRRNKYGQGVTIPQGSGQPEGPSSWQLEILAQK